VKAILLWQLRQCRFLHLVLRQSNSHSAISSGTGWT
jgi:hypothetical protein